jgi:hypothetical protein
MRLAWCVLDNYSAGAEPVRVPGRAVRWLQWGEWIDGEPETVWIVRRGVDPLLKRGSTAHPLFWLCEHTAYDDVDGKPIMTPVPLPLSDLTVGTTWPHDAAACWSQGVPPSHGEMLFYHRDVYGGQWVRLPIGALGQVLAVVDEGGLGTRLQPGWVTPPTALTLPEVEPRCVMADGDDPAPPYWWCVSGDCVQAAEQPEDSTGPYSSFSECAEPCGATSPPPPPPPPDNCFGYPCSVSVTLTDGTNTATATLDPAGQVGTNCYWFKHNPGLTIPGHSAAYCYFNCYGPTTAIVAYGSGGTTSALPTLVGADWVLTIASGVTLTFSSGAPC